ncbi:MAG: RdgB/HAM1 family non-canonical purine NTP pyrophosphatase [Phycisphaerales bacterium]|nr:RdgB/HAM1 family non-canonical purine NTP pyrophosphatase [Phycisphaerales bacterium]
MTTIVLATQNPGKIREMRALLADSGTEILGLDDLGQSFTEPDETGTTFAENATIKATTYARLTGHWCLADDSGLEVDALRGAPGVISSHYAFGGETGGRAAELTREQRDAENITRLLNDLDAVDIKDRAARFVCTMVLSDPQGQIHATTTGAFEGIIGLPGDVPRGEGGFGYDPVFLVAPEHTRASSELSPDEKNALSHRGQAVRAMISAIGSIPELSA